METISQTTSTLQIITNFAEHNTGLFIFVCILIFLVFALCLFFIAKAGVFLAKRINKLKLGGNEIQLGEDSKPIEDQKSEKYTKFASTISAIIQYSINTGYENSQKRQELFDVQMTHAKENFDIIQTAIIENYISEGGQNVEIAKTLLHHVINKVIILRFRSICVADRLAEKTKEGIIELNRNFIDSAYTDAWIELKNLINYTIKTEKNNTEYSDQLLLDSLKQQKDSIKKMITNSLEYAHTQALNFLTEVQECNKQLNDKIQNLLNIHFEGTAEEFQQSWVSESVAIPPNSVVGA